MVEVGNEEKAWKIDERSEIEEEREQVAKTMGRGDKDQKEQEPM